MDMNGQIDLSKVVNPIHFGRIIERMIDMNEEEIFFNEDEFYNPEYIKIMIEKWHKTDWLKLNQEIEK